MTSRTTPASGVPNTSTIGDYGLIGDLHTAALVDRWGRMDWLCWPRFNSPPLLRRLLDPSSGTWRMAPAVPFAAERRYVPDTNIVESTFSCADGVVTGTDFMAVPHDAGLGSQVVRTLEGRSGAVPVRLLFAATGGFGEAAVSLHGDDGRVVVELDSAATAVLSSGEPITAGGNRATLERVLEPGQRLVTVLSAHPPRNPLTRTLAACTAPRFGGGATGSAAVSCPMPGARPLSTAPLR